MLPYFFIAFILLIFSWIPLLQNQTIIQFFKFLIFLILLLFIGLRYKVGGDWFSYLFYYKVTLNHNLFQILFLSDPGYMFINWLCSRCNLGIGCVNLISGFIFLIGLFNFIEKLNLPFYTYFIAYPYLIMVISMGYTRQSIAIGIIMIAYIKYIESKFLQTIIYIFLAALFHKTALFAYTIFLSDKRVLFKPIYLILSLSVVFFIFNLMQNKFNSMYDIYIGRHAKSGGAFLRLFLNSVSGVIFIFFRKQWKKLFDDFNLWFLLSILSMSSFLLMYLSSTVADRLSLYLIPLQLIVFGRLPFLIKNEFLRLLVFLIILILYFLYLIIWLFYANHRLDWIPYQNIFFKGLF